MRQTNSNGPPKRSTFHHGHYEKKIKKNPDGGRRVLLYIMGALLIPAFGLLTSGMHVNKMNHDGTTISQATTTTATTVTNSKPTSTASFEKTTTPTTTAFIMHDAAKAIALTLWHGTTTAFFFGKQLTEPTFSGAVNDDAKKTALHVLMRAASSSTRLRPLVT